MCVCVCVCGRVLAGTCVGVHMCVTVWVRVCTHNHIYIIVHACESACVQVLVTAIRKTLNFVSLRKFKHNSMSNL